MNRLDLLRCPTSRRRMLLLGKLRNSVLQPYTRGTVVLYDTYVMTLLPDGTVGEAMGILKVEDIFSSNALLLESPHFHRGGVHRFAITQTHLARIRNGTTVFLETSEVDGHRHQLFIDSRDPRWRVKGALPVEIPVEMVH